MTKNIMEMDGMNTVPNPEDGMNASGEQPIDKVPEITVDPIPAAEEVVKTEETPKAGEVQPEPQVPEKTIEEVDPALSKEEVKDIKEEIAQQADEKKEEIKEEMKNKEPDHFEKIVDALLEDQMELEFKVKEADKRATYFEEEYNKIRKDLNNIKYDDSKIAVSEDDRPFLKILYEYRSNKDNKELEHRLLSRIFELASDITQEDYTRQVRDFYTGSAKKVKAMAEPAGGYSAFVAPTAGYKPTGIVRSGTKRF